MIIYYEKKRVVDSIGSGCLYTIHIDGGKRGEIASFPSYDPKSGDWIIENRKPLAPVPAPRNWSH